MFVFYYAVTQNRPGVIFTQIFGVKPTHNKNYPLFSSQYPCDLAMLKLPATKSNHQFFRLIPAAERNVHPIFINNLRIAVSKKLKAFEKILLKFIYTPLLIMSITRQNCDICQIKNQL